MKPQAKLGARFVLDDAGNPQVIESSTTQGLKHYKIELFTVEPPGAAQSVVYHLHDSYYDPVREVPRRAADDDFAEPITSFGDYQVRLAVSGSTGPVDAAYLSDALRRGHKDQLALSNAIRQAIADLESR